MITIKNLHKHFGEKKILDGINLEIVEGKCTAIFGLSGGGKSTIIKHIVGLLKPDSGSILFRGVDIAKLNEDNLRKVRRDIGFLFQSGALFDSMNVFDNIAFALRENKFFDEEYIHQEVYESIKLVDLDPNIVSKLFPDELSGGMRKRIGLARTIISKPKVILYDEPTSGLDPITSDVISMLIVSLQKQMQTTSVLISHDIKETFKTADYFAMLYEGKIVEYGDAKDFLDSKVEIVKKFLDQNNTYIY